MQEILYIQYFVLFLMMNESRFFIFEYELVHIFSLQHSLIVKQSQITRFLGIWQVPGFLLGNFV